MLYNNSDNSIKYRKTVRNKVKIKQVLLYIDEQVKR